MSILETYWSNAVMLDASFACMASVGLTYNIEISRRRPKIKREVNIDAASDSSAHPALLQHS